jgi:hypothetical protein
MSSNLEVKNLTSKHDGSENIVKQILECPHCSDWIQVNIKMSKDWRFEKIWLSQVTLGERNR